MTVCVGVKVRDCIVFAADSAISMSSNDGQVHNIWDHGIKVFNLYRGLPIVAMSSGIASFGTQSVYNLAKDLRVRFSSGAWLNPASYTIKEVAEKSLAYFFGHYSSVYTLDTAPTEPFTFWVGGYGSQGVNGEIWETSIQDLNPRIKLMMPGEEGYVIWGGQKEPISRLIHGMSPTVHNFMVNKEISNQDIGDLLNTTTASMVDVSMPVQDAIDLSKFLVYITKMYFYFNPGADVVGGDVDIAVVTRHENFKWVQRKHFYPEHLNRGDINHV